MPRVHYVSDLHLELRHTTRLVPRSTADLGAIAGRMSVTGERPVFWLPDTDADVIVLGGDIDVGVRGVEWAMVETQLLGTPIIYVPGNHEYYGQEMGPTLEAMRERAVGTDVHVLDCDEVTVGGVRYLGATLWTDYKAGEPTTPQALAMQVAQQQINDHRQIRYWDRLFTPADAVALHQQARAWLAERLSRTHEGPTVVVTHHGPSPACQHPDYPVDAISAAFQSNLEALMSPSIDLWIYGHTHACLDTFIHGVHLVSNQKGYPRETVPGYDLGKTVEIAGLSEK